MDNQALVRLEALRRLVRRGLGLESRMPLTWPVRFGRGRLDSLARKGLAAYLMCVLRGESGSANDGWPYWKEVGNAPPYGLSPSSPDTFPRKGGGDNSMAAKGE